MGDITSIFGGPFICDTSPKAKPYIDEPEAQLIDAIRSAGLIPPDSIRFDGKIHRWNGTKRKDKASWYLAFGDGVAAGKFGDWSLGLEVPWRAEMVRPFTIHEEMEFTARMKAAREARDEELARSQLAVSLAVEQIWNSATAASPDHPYLSAKGIAPHGAKVTGDGRLIVPMYGPDWSLCSLQYISTDGIKRYHDGGKAGEAFCQIGEDDSGVVYVAEGFATAATIHEQTNRACFAAYSASNIVPVTKMLREKYGIGHQIVIVADNDTHNVGQSYADQACAKHGARYVMPPIPGMDANDYHQAGHDLLKLLEPPTNDWLVSADDFCRQPSPIKWLVKRWLQENALIMVHGPSGGGKTFLVLDWCLHMSASKHEWGGNKVKPGRVVYLAGEGHHGLKGRIAGWKQYNRAQSLNMFLSKAGCDLNTAQGYQVVVDSIRSLPGESPSLIVVDTLHRFLMGDENSAQDAKTMLDACSALMGEFNCSVLLVHHTGVSEEAQHRARGSSAWKGALEIEINISPAKDGEPMKVAQKKSKDAELAPDVYAELMPINIFGWLDEDGEPVSTAVVKLVDPPENDTVSAKVDNPLSTAKKHFERAWFHTGGEFVDDKPYVSRAGLHAFFVECLGASDRTAKNHTYPSHEKGTVARLVTPGIIEPCEHGWVVVDAVMASAMIMSATA